MAVEQYTESLTLLGMKCVLGENDFGFVYPQGDVSEVSKAERLLLQAGGKPKECAIDDYTKGGTGKAKPEYIITFKDDVHTIIVVQTAIDNVLNGSGIKANRIDYIKQAFKNLLDNSKFAAIPLGNKKSIVWYLEELEMKIKPMMDHADSTIDALGVFYHEFIKYSGGDGSGLGIILTPQHLTEFMCDLAGVNKYSRVVDICCGSGSFLVTAMSKMFTDANPNEIERIRQDGLYGVEFDDELYTLAVANMIIRKDGKSNVYFGDCFDSAIVRDLKAKNINIGLINPPYSQDDVVELEFVEHLLDILTVDGTGVVVVPMSCAIGTKFKEVRKRLFEKGNKLKTKK